MSWNQALVRLREEGLLENVPEDMEEALMSLLFSRGQFYRAVKSLPRLEASPSREHLAVATECAAAAVVLHRKAASTTGWPSASCLLLGDGLLTLAFALVGRQPEIDVLGFSALVGQLFGARDPEVRLKGLIARDCMASVLR